MNLVWNPWGPFPSLETSTRVAGSGRLAATGGSVCCVCAGGPLRRIRAFVGGRGATRAGTLRPEGGALPEEITGGTPELCTDGGDGREGGPGGDGRDAELGGIERAGSGGLLAGCALWVGGGVGREGGCGGAPLPGGAPTGRRAALEGRFGNGGGRRDMICLEIPSRRAVHLRLTCALNSEKHVHF